MNMQTPPPAAGDPLGVLMVVIGTAILLYSSYLAIRASVRPGETDPEHPKHVILRDDR